MTLTSYIHAHVDHQADQLADHRQTERPQVEDAPTSVDRGVPTVSLLAKLVDMVEELRARQLEDGARLTALMRRIETAAPAAQPQVQSAPDLYALTEAVSRTARQTISETLSHDLTEALRRTLPNAVDLAMRAVLAEHAQEEAEAAAPAPTAAPSAPQPQTPTALTLDPAALADQVADQVAVRVADALAPNFAAAPAAAPVDAIEAIAERVERQSSRSTDLIAAAERQSERLDAAARSIDALVAQLSVAGAEISVAPAASLDQDALQAVTERLEQAVRVATERAPLQIAQPQQAALQDALPDALQDAPALAAPSAVVAPQVEDLQFRLAEYAERLARTEADLRAKLAEAADAEIAAALAGRFEWAAEEIARASNKLLDKIAEEMRARAEISETSETAETRTETAAA